MERVNFESSLEDLLRGCQSDSISESFSDLTESECVERNVACVQHTIENYKDTFERIGFELESYANPNFELFVMLTSTALEGTIEIENFIPNWFLSLRTYVVKHYEGVVYSQEIRVSKETLLDKTGVEEFIQNLIRVLATTILNGGK